MNSLKIWYENWAEIKKEESRGLHLDLDTAWLETLPVNNQVPYLPANVPGKFVNLQILNDFLCCSIVPLPPAHYSCRGFWHKDSVDDPKLFILDSEPNQTGKYRYGSKGRFGCRFWSGSLSVKFSWNFRILSRNVHQKLNFVLKSNCLGWKLCF